jgi:uncharacterized protein (TIRG00374 family)
MAGRYEVLTAPARPTIVRAVRLSRRSVPWLIVLAIVAAGAYSLAGDLGKLRERIGGFHWWAFGATVCLACVNYALRFTRWQLYLRHQGITVPRGDSAIVFGSGLSLAITPAKLGELVKSYLLRELHDVPVVKTAPIVVAERVTDLIALLGVAVVGVALYGMQTTLVLAAAALIATGLALLAWPRPTRWILLFVTGPAKLRKLRQPLLDMYDGLASLCGPKTLLVATAIAVPAWACECVGFGLIINAFPGVECDFGLAFVIYAATTIAGALSFLPGGLGVTEGGMALLLGQAGVEKAAALGATLLTRLATLWFAVVVGLAFLAIARRRVARRVRHSAR